MIDMSTVTVSPKYQVVIPQAVRQRLGIAPGDRMAVLDVGGHIELVPITPARELQGLLAGMDIRVPDEADRF